MGVYLDNNATSPMDPKVLESMRPFFLNQFGNASSIHALGQDARSAVEIARSEVAKLLGARPREVVFTSGGTEADNSAILGVTRCFRDKPAHIVTSSLEHPAVLKTCDVLRGWGIDVTFLPGSPDGLVSVEQVESALRNETVLISIMCINNEVGTIQPIEQIGQLAKRHGVLFHTDAVQAVGKIDVDVRQLGVDLLALSGHKFHGPKGVGVLFIRDSVNLAPFLLGGSHERQRRAGTENVPGIVGLGEACHLARNRLGEMSRVGLLRDRLEKGLLEQVKGAKVNGNTDQRCPHTTNISFSGVEGEALLIALDFKGISVSTGAACASGSLEPSHVLQSMKMSEDRIKGAIRFSLSRMTKHEEIDYALQVIPETVDRIRQVGV